MQPLATVRRQNIDVLSGGNTAQQNDLAVARQAARQDFSIAHKRPAIPRVFRINRHAGKAGQPAPRNHLIERNQAPARHNHERGGITRFATAECFRIRDFPPEVEPAHEREHLNQSRPTGAQSQSQLKVSFLSKQITGPLSRASSRRKQKDPIHEKDLPTTCPIVIRVAWCRLRTPDEDPSWRIVIDSV
jgi:hypothetical protein